MKIQEKGTDARDDSDGLDELERSGVKFSRYEKYLRSQIF